MTNGLKLKELERELLSVKSPVLDFFLDGLKKQTIISFFEKEELDPPEDLIELYEWKNGVRFKDIPAGKLSFGVDGVFFPIEQSIRIYKADKATLVNFFPIFSDDSFLFNLDRTSDGFGKIFFYCPSLQINEPQSYFDSVPCMIETFIVCFRRGAFYYDKDGFFTKNYTLNQELAKEINPNSAYWKS